MGYGVKIAALPTIARVAVVAQDNVWMTSSLDKDGNLVDEPPDPYMIPIDAAAIDQIAYARFLPPRPGRWWPTCRTVRRSWDRPPPSSGIWDPAA